MILIIYLTGISIINFSYAVADNMFFNLIKSTESGNESDKFSEFPKSQSKAYIEKKLLAIAIPWQINKKPQSYFNNLKIVPTAEKRDPISEFEGMINAVLFGNPQDGDANNVPAKNTTEAEVDVMAHFPSGQVMRAEIFRNKSAVHLPPTQLLHRGHCYLQITEDLMQTALNAFAILLHGTIDDVLRLPPFYVLRSARTISMMKIAHEKLVATWTVVKADHEPHEITHHTLELYRPLFKYLNGKEIAKLNLSDEKILSYIGTHSDLSRHQVGVVASRYIKINKNWREARYLNLMNNLLCGVPMLFMRNIRENTYLQLSHQLFYHIRACDPLQKRWYLAKMTRTQVLGKSNSWSASDVARLGLLLTEVDAPDLSAINPQAMAGITAQVMLEMEPQNLKHFTAMQLKFIAPQPMHILAKKLHRYKDTMAILNIGSRLSFCRIFLALQLLIIIGCKIMFRRGLEE